MWVNQNSIVEIWRLSEPGSVKKSPNLQPWRRIKRLPYLPNKLNPGSVGPYKVQETLEANFGKTDYKIIQNKWIVFHSNDLKGKRGRRLW